MKISRFIKAAWLSRNLHFGHEPTSNLEFIFSASLVLIHKNASMLRFGYCITLEANGDGCTNICGKSFPNWINQSRMKCFEPNCIWSISCVVNVRMTFRFDERRMKNWYERKKTGERVRTRSLHSCAQIQSLNGKTNQRKIPMTAKYQSRSQNVQCEMHSLKWLLPDSIQNPEVRENFSEKQRFCTRKIAGQKVYGAHFCVNCEFVEVDRVTRGAMKATTERCMFRVERSKIKNIVKLFALISRSLSLFPCCWFLIWKMAYGCERSTNRIINKTYFKCNELLSASFSIARVHHTINQASF